MAAGATFLNLANPVQNPDFLGEFFQNFQKTALDIPAPKTFSHFGKILHPEKKTLLPPKIAILHARTQVLLHKHRVHPCATKGFDQDCYFTCKNPIAIARA